MQQRFEHLDSSHIEKVPDGIRENTTRVWNTRAYILAGNHYTMPVNHDIKRMLREEIRQMMAQE